MLIPIFIYSREMSRSVTFNQSRCMGFLCSEFVIFALDFQFLLNSFMTILLLNHKTLS